MITVTRYIDGQPAVVIRSIDEIGEKLPVSWDNGDFVHLSLAGFEIVMPPQTWERVWREIRAVLEDRRPRPAPHSVTGKNAADVRTLPDSTVVHQRLADVLALGGGEDVAADDALLDEAGRGALPGAGA